MSFFAQLKNTHLQIFCYAAVEGKRRVKKGRESEGGRKKEEWEREREKEMSKEARELGREVGLGGICKLTSWQILHNLCKICKNV